MIKSSRCSAAVGARGAAAIVETDQVVDISLSVCVTGRYAEIDVANRLAVADRKSTGIVSEPHHCGTHSRAEYCKFYWIFHRFLVGAISESNRRAKRQNIVTKIF